MPLYNVISLPYFILHLSYCWFCPPLFMYLCFAFHHYIVTQFLKYYSHTVHQRSWSAFQMSQTVVWVYLTSQRNFYCKGTNKSVNKWLWLTYGQQSTESSLLKHLMLLNRTTSYLVLYRHIASSHFTANY